VITRNDLKPIREQLYKARIMLATMPLRSRRQTEAVDLLESAIGKMDELISRPTIASRYAATKGAR
jgi:hypothetical protein